MFPPPCAHWAGHMTQRGSGCTQRMGSELVLQHSTPSLVLPMHLCAADISQIYNSMEAVPRVLCCSKAACTWFRRQPLASCVGSHFVTAPQFCPPSTLHVSPLLQDSPIALTTGGVVLVLDLEFIGLITHQCCFHLLCKSQHISVIAACH